MQDRVLKLLFNEKHKLKEKEMEIRSFTEDPLILFSDLQYNKDIIPDLLLSVSEDLLLEYQSWQYPYISRAISDKFSISPYIISWNKDDFPSPILFMREGYATAAIHPYDNTFEILTSNEVDVVADTYRRCVINRITKWEEVEKIKLNYMNPFIGGDDSLFGTIKTTFNKKNIQKELESEMQLAISELDYLIDKENKAYYQLKKTANEESLEKDGVIKLYRKVGKPLELKLIDGYTIFFEELDEEIRIARDEATQRVQEYEELAINTEQY